MIGQIQIGSPKQKKAMTLKARRGLWRAGSKERERPDDGSITSQNYFKASKPAHGPMR